MPIAIFPTCCLRLCLLLIGPGATAHEGVHSHAKKIAGVLTAGIVKTIFQQV